MSLAQRFERRLEGLVGGAFARVFKGQVEPVEIGTALQREAADKRNVMGNGKVLSPNTCASSPHACRTTAISWRQGPPGHTLSRRTRFRCANAGAASSSS